ncbi:MAG: phosphoribosyltransferase family protein [Clostridiales bacterium]|jgi:adenine/guanine phosphoribosyltransferase-like PRPP-binding protein|nr:phosphoribosyltransferase family protein [Clostridiales bacterium]
MQANLKIAIRDSKTATRPYVIVNPLLAKHIPVAPGDCLKYFFALADMIAQACGGERVLVIGFAETATAIGAAVAARIPDAVYVHTTREFSDAPLVAEFLEEHSHARNQALYMKEYKLSDFTKIVFVEDEITTGKTILNFLKSIKFDGKIIVSALVFNGFDEGVFKEHDAEFFCVQKTGYFSRHEINFLSNPRVGVSIADYQRECLNVAEKIISQINGADINKKNILVIGTEEFMYPTLILGQCLENFAQSVKTQSTTRSPLLPKNEKDYPFFARDEFVSVYDRERTTYLYNLQKYDTVIILTDAQEPNADELIRAIQSHGNQIIHLVEMKNV